MAIQHFLNAVVISPFNFLLPIPPLLPPSGQFQVHMPVTDHLAPLEALLAQQGIAPRGIDPALVIGQLDPLLVFMIPRAHLGERIFVHVTGNVRVERHGAIKMNLPVLFLLTGDHGLSFGILHGVSLLRLV